MSNFMKLALAGEVLLEEIDDFVGRWHESDSSETLHDFLGMTFSEYQMWVDDEDMLSQIVAARHDNVSVETFKSAYAEMRLAARAEKSNLVKLVAKWLETYNA